MNLKFWKTAPSIDQHTAQWQQSILAVATQSAAVEQACALRAEQREIELNERHEARQVRMEAERAAHIKKVETQNALQTALLAEIRDTLRTRAAKLTPAEDDQAQAMNDLRP